MQQLAMGAAWDASASGDECVAPNEDHDATMLGSSSSRSITLAVGAPPARTARKKMPLRVRVRVGGCEKVLRGGQTDATATSNTKNTQTRARARLKRARPQRGRGGSPHQRRLRRRRSRSVGVTSNYVGRLYV